MAVTTTRWRSSDLETVVVVVAGEIDVASAPRLSAFIDGIYFPYETVRLDLGRTAFADGALLRLLDTERARRAPHRAGVEIIRASPAVRRVPRQSAKSTTSPGGSARAVIAIVCVECPAKGSGRATRFRYWGPSTEGDLP